MKKIGCYISIILILVLGGILLYINYKSLQKSRETDKKIQDLLSIFSGYRIEEVNFITNP